MRFETTTRTTSEASSIVAMALIDGSTPRRIRPQTSTGTVSWLPMLNQVTTNSSSDSAAASSAAPTSDGRISGKVMSRKARDGRGAEVARRFEYREVEGLEPRVHGQDDEGQADEDMADRGVDEARRQAERAEEDGQRDADDEQRAPPPAGGCR